MSTESLKELARDIVQANRALDKSFRRAFEGQVYLFTLEVVKGRKYGTGALQNTVVEKDIRQAEGCAVWEAAHKLGLKADDVVFITKEKVK